MRETTWDGREWTFVLLNKGTSLAAWWLRLTTLDELADYLAATNGRYARALQNYLSDGAYQSGVVGHGRHAAEAPLTLAAHLRGVNRGESIVEALVGVEMDAARAMAERMKQVGHVYVNAHGGWNCLDVRPETGDVVHSRRLAWPQFTPADIRVSRFPGGRHWYARVGAVDVHNGDTLRFRTRAEAVDAATRLVTPRPDTQDSKREREEPACDTASPTSE